MPPIRRKPSLPPAVIHRPSLPPTVIRRPTAIVHQPIASSSPPTMGSMVKSGFSWGLGNGIANALIGPLFNKGSTDPSPSNEYVQCMKDFDDKEACKHHLK